MYHLFVLSSHQEDPREALHLIPFFFSQLLPPSSQSVEGRQIDQANELAASLRAGFLLLFLPLRGLRLSKATKATYFP